MKAPLERVAFSPGEFAALFGKEQTLGYRQIYAGKVKAISEHGAFEHCDDAALRPKKNQTGGFPHVQCELLTFIFASSWNRGAD